MRKDILYTSTVAKYVSNKINHIEHFYCLTKLGNIIDRKGYNMFSRYVMFIVLF